MAELLGIIAPLKKFMSGSRQEISIPLKGGRQTVLVLKENRVYNIPDFQREIRWTCDNIATLIEDINSGPKFLGNIILTKHPDNTFSIIDGQQRITILTMILSCIKRLHEEELDTITPCQLTIESFAKFSELVDSNFDRVAWTKDVLESDKLKQIAKYENIWKYILGLGEIKDKYKAKSILENLGACTFNIIVNETDDVGEGIRYFIDVNLKGKQLDTEDIFKSYLFKNDSGREIRELWYLLKTTVSEIEESKMNYTLLKLLEHYFLCDLYSENKFKGVEFSTEFLLKKPYVEDAKTHKEGTHLIELINDNGYMKKSLHQLNEIARVMLKIVQSESVTEEIKTVLSCDGGDRIDNEELKVIHNIISKILKDGKVLPKALIIKYFLVLLYGNGCKDKETIRSIYGIYLFSVLFTIFESKKSADVLIGIIKADNSQWYNELIKQINGYFVEDGITDARLLAQYKFGRNEEEEDQSFRCKSLAAVYNFLVCQEGKVKVRKGKMKELYKFITDANAFSLEHFIISQTPQKSMNVQGKTYVMDETIYKRYVNNFFNFIFIDQAINSELGNDWLPQKLEKLENQSIPCEYSQMVIANVSKLGTEFGERAGEDFKDKLDLFFARDYKELYIEYTRTVLKDIINRLKCYNDMN